MEQSIADICCETSFKPEMVLEVVPALMNTLVVKVMKGELHC